MTTPADARKNLILEALRNKAMTTEELADVLGFNYHTTYKTCRDLQELGLIHYTGQVKGKSYVWGSGAKSEMPEFYDPAGNRKIRADDIVIAFSEHRDAASIKAARAFFEILEQLLTIARELSEGEKI